MNVLGGLLPERIRMNLQQTVLPFGFARLLSLGTPALLQLCLLLRFGTEEAGIYWILASTVFMLVVICDAGAGSAFPILFGPEPGREHPQLIRILRIRLAFAGVAAIILGSLGGVGRAMASHPLERAALMFLLIGRVLLASHQGFHYAREQFQRLLFAAAAEFAVVVTGFAIIAGVDFAGHVLPGRPATEALMLLSLATWIAIVILDVPVELWGFGTAKGKAGKKAAPPLRASTPDSPSVASEENLDHPFVFLGPFALCAIGGAIFTKGDAIVAGFVLDPAAAGVLGTLEALYRLAVFPVYMSGQGLFPALRAAWLRGDSDEMRRLAGLHRDTGLRLTTITLILAGAALIAMDRWMGAGMGSDWHMAVIWYVVAIPVAIPNAFIVPDYFCRDQQHLVARLSLFFALTRPLMALVLGARAGLVGMVLNHLLFDLLQGVIFGVVIPWREGRFRAS